MNTKIITLRPSEVHIKNDRSSEQHEIDMFVGMTGITPEEWIYNFKSGLIDISMGLNREIMQAALRLSGMSLF